MSCLFVCLFGVNKASQEGALQRHAGIELSFIIPMYDSYNLGCHRRYSPEPMLLSLRPDATLYFFIGPKPAFLLYPVVHEKRMNTYLMNTCILKGR
jgi:hypothetical protein